MERFIPEKKKSVKEPKFSEEELFERIQLANSSFDSSLPLSEDGEISQRNVSENLEQAIRKVGSDCVDYEDVVLRIRRGIESWTITCGGVAVVMLGLVTNNPVLEVGGLVPSFFGVLKYINASMRKIDLKNTDSLDELGDKKKIVENDFLALSLPEEYIDKKFYKIVKVFAKMQRPIRDEEKRIRRENEEMEIEAKKEALIREKRRELGLDDEQEIDQNLDDLLKTTFTKSSK